MGNIDSRARFHHGHIFLQTDHSYAIAGDNMTGNIYLDLTQPYPAVSLDIIVRGEEKCRWTERKTRTVRDSDGKSKTETYYVHHSGGREVIHQQFTIYVFPSQAAMPGQYTFPFNISIPYGCPSSAFFTGTESAVASIKYSIKAVLRPHVHIRIQEMEFKQSLIIREKASIVQQDLFSSAEMEINSCCCCCSKGRASLTTRFEKNAYTGVETCRALCEVNNDNCRIPVVRIKINIKQFVILTAYSSVYRRTFKKGERIYEGVNANAKAIGTESRYLEIPLYEMKNIINKHEYTDFGFYDEDMYLAQTLQPTTTGLHLNITYQLAVELDYDTYCAAMPTCTIPLFIQAPELQNFQLAQAPPGWNPQVFDAANFALPVPSTEIRIDMPYPGPSEHQRLLEEEKHYDPNQAYIPNQNYAPGMPAPAPGMPAPGMPAPGMSSPGMAAPQPVPIPAPAPYPGASGFPGQMPPPPVPVPVAATARKNDWDV